MTEHQPDATQSRFRALQCRFVAGLPRRWLDITEGSSAASLQSALHQLAGSAGSYGFDRLGTLARDAEKLAGAGGPAAAKPTLDAMKMEIDGIQAAWAPPAHPRCD